MDGAGYSQAVLKLGVINGVAAEENNAGLMHHVQSAFEDLPQDGKIHGILGEADDV